MARWKPGDKINYEVGVYYADEDKSVVGILPPPERLMQSCKEFFEVVGIKVSVEMKAQRQSKTETI